MSSCAGPVKLLCYLVTPIRPSLSGVGDSSKDWPRREYIESLFMIVNAPPQHALGSNAIPCCAPKLYDVYLDKLACYSYYTAALI